MEYLDLSPIARVSGSITLPGSKSISNRTLLLAALAEGVTEVKALLASDDTGHMLEALKQLGVRWEQHGDSRDYRVQGVGGAFPIKQGDLFLGNAGTAFRPLTAVLALCQGDYQLSGVPRMHERPIGDLVDSLRQLGADIRYLGNEGFPPLAIKPAAIHAAGNVKIRGNVSSQFLTALLMAAPLAGQDVHIEVIGELISKPYIEITLNLMRRFGVEVERQGWQVFTIRAGQKYTSPGEIHVEGDASSASYFLAAGAIGKGPVRVEGVGRTSIQGDVRFAEALAQMGARIEMGDNWIESSGTGKLQAIDLDCNHIPDAAMTLAVAALFADGTTTLRNIASWRVKETDRIAAMATELRKVGATVEEGPDFIRITPPHPFSPEREPSAPLPAGMPLAGTPLTPHAVIDTYDDHRMAMCFALVALSGAPVRINDPKCVAKTFPDYFEKLQSIAHQPDISPFTLHASHAIPVIAIDGPSASGKGTVAALIAKELGFHYLDSGAIYRVTALAALRAGISLDDEEALAQLAGQLDVRFDNGEIWLAGEKVGDDVRSEASGNAASKIATLPRLRQALLEFQRSFRTAPGLVADGRDMGSVVFPDATLKIFLTASAEVRAERRHKQLMEKGMHANLSQILQDLQQRDARDCARSVAPLQKFADAHLLETSTLNIAEAVAEVLALYREGVRQAS